MASFLSFQEQNDSVSVTSTIPDSNNHPKQSTKVLQPDSANQPQLQVKAETVKVNTPKAVIKAEINEDTTSKTLVVVPTNPLQPEQSAYQYNLPLAERFTFFSSNESFSYKVSFKYEGRETRTIFENTSLAKVNHQSLQSNINWTLLITLISLSLILALRTYYEKFVRQVMNSTFNFQLADKMLREKNILVRRAFFMLNINFFVMVSLFILLFARLKEIIPAESSLIKYYFYIALLVLGFLVVRFIVLKILGYVFDIGPVTSEYLHNIFLVNKNTGLILLPLVFLAVYTQPGLSAICIYTGLTLIVAAALLKLIRGLQIVIKNGILLFYSFLYLCTLELLPLVLGSKIIMSLR